MQEDQICKQSRVKRNIVWNNAYYPVCNSEFHSFTKFNLASFALIYRPVVAVVVLQTVLLLMKKKKKNVLKYGFS